MEFRDVVKRRRSVRTYRKDLPPRELLQDLVDIARRAPTAGFAQGVDFLVLDDPDTVSDFYGTTDPPGFEIPEALRSTRPPVIVLVMSDPLRYRDRYSEDDKKAFGLDDLSRWSVPFWDIDAAMAAMQLQLAAVDAGIDTWFFGTSHGERELRDRLRVPDDRSIVGVVGLGYRTDDERPFGSGAKRPRRPLAEQFHLNGW
jgi:nitroreductase